MYIQKNISLKVGNIKTFFNTYFVINFGISNFSLNLKKKCFNLFVVKILHKYMLSFREYV